MLRVRRLVLTACCALLGCGGAPPEVTLFHTNDIHSHLVPVRSDPFGLGGLARLQTLLTQRRALAPNSITLDAGDWSEGTWFYAVDTGASTLRALKGMGYDAVSLGNHDFFSGPDRLLDTLAAAGEAPPVLAANLEVPLRYARRAELREAIRPSSKVLVAGNGVRVGVIGLTTYEGLYDSFLAPVGITNPLVAATEAAAELRGQVDVLVLLSHNSLEANLALARTVPGVDVVVSGHSHRKTPAPVMVTNALGTAVPVVEAGEWGEFLGELTLSVEGGLLQRVKVKGYQLHPVSPDLAEDPGVAAQVAALTARLSAQVGRDVEQVVSESDFALGRSDTGESPLGNLSARAYREAASADLGLEAASLTGVALPRGPLTLMDLHDVAPHLFRPDTGREWTVRVWSARGDELELALQTFATTSALLGAASPIGWLTADNAELTWDPDALPALTSIRIGGKPLDRRATYRVALSEGLLSALAQANGALDLGLSFPGDDTGIETWRAVEAYAEAHGQLLRADLEVGGRVRTAGPDLALASDDLSWDGATLSVRVRNLGGRAAHRGRVTCARGEVNAPAVFGTDAQRWRRLGEAELPALASGGEATVALPWASVGLAAGSHPVRCTASAGDEAYAGNNAAQHVFQVEATSGSAGLGPLGGEADAGPGQAPL